MAPDRASYAGRRAWVLLAAAVFLLADLQSFPIAPWDESRLAVNAMEMRASGLSLVTTFGFQPDLWNTKPPLLIWLMVACAQVFGPHEWALRLTSGLATLGSVAVTMALARRMSRSAFAPVAAALLLLTSRGFVGRHVAQTADYDALLCLFTTAYGSVFFLALHRRRPPWRWTLLAGALVGGAVLTKGIAGLIPGVGVALYLLVQRRWMRPLQSPAWIAAAGLALALAGAFYGLREAAAPGYLAAVGDNELGRSATKLAGHVKPVTFYLTYIFAAFGFSAGLLALPLLAEVRKLGGRRRDGMVFCLCMAGGVIGAYSLCQTRIRWYGAPVYPFLAIACALGLESLTARLEAGGWRARRLLAGGAVVLCGVILVLRDAVPLIKGEKATYQYGQVFERLRRQGVRRVQVAEGGIPNDEKDFPEYAPQLDFYILQERERGMAITRLPATRPIPWRAGEVVATCDRGWTGILARHGEELAGVRGCAAVRGR